MNYTHLFEIKWDDSYNDPDYSIPGTFGIWMAKNPEKRERLAKQMEWIAECIRENKCPFDSKKPKITLSGNPPQPNCENIGAPAPIDPTTGMHKDYWILSDEERAKGFVRSVRTKYVHVGQSVCGKMIKSDDKKIGGIRNVCTMLPKHKGKCIVFTQMTQTEHAEVESTNLLGGCGGVTVMGIKLSETYARDPKFYGATFCAFCKGHYPVGEHGEFIWDGTNERVGT